MQRTCECGLRFQNVFQLGPHRRFCAVARALQQPTETDHSDPPESDHTDPPESATESDRPDSLADCDHADQSGPPDPDPPSVLARRTPAKGFPAWYRSVSIEFQGRPPLVRDLLWNYCSMQRLWQQYVSETHACCCSDFWKIYESVIDQPIRCRDAVLETVHNVIEQREHQKIPKWSRTNRALREWTERKNGGFFWDMVMRSHTIDLRRFGLPGCDSIKFEFVDPVFVWIQRCNELSKRGVPLKWDPVSHLHPRSGQPVYGAGIECGLLLRAATASIPAGAKVALINLSWDGGNTAYVGRSSCPITVQVMNVNDGTVLAVGLLGYLPYLETDVKGTVMKKAAKQYLLQVLGGRACVRSITLTLTLTLTLTDFLQSCMFYMSTCTNVLYTDFLQSYMFYMSTCTNVLYTDFLHTCMFYMSTCMFYMSTCISYCTCMFHIHRLVSDLFSTSSNPGPVRG